MNFITRNKGALLSLMFDTLDRKSITNQEDRNNYKDILLDYCTFLHRLSFVDISELNIKLNKQRVLLDKLDTLTQRYKSIGIDCIPDKSVESFLTNIQEHMRDWLNSDLNIELWKEEVRYFTNASSKLEMNQGAGLERRKSEAVDVLMNSNRNRVNF
jgi:hypothetical protein